MTIGEKKYVDPVFVEPDKQQISTVNLQAYKILFVGNSITRHGKSAGNMKPAWRLLPKKTITPTGPWR